MSGISDATFCRFRLCSKVGILLRMNTCLPPQNAGAYLNDTLAEFHIVPIEFWPNAGSDLEDGEIYGVGAMVTPPNLSITDEAYGGPVV